MSGAFSNDIPYIPVYWSEGAGEQAEAAGYGIEEEGIPWKMLPSEDPEKDAAFFITGPGLGTALAVSGARICLYSRVLKEKRPFLVYEAPGPELAKRAGQNAARIVRQRPLLMQD